MLVKMEPEDLERICSNGSAMACKESPACADVEILFVVFMQWFLQIEN